MKIPVFPNLGNTCYLSSVLQSLLNSRGFNQNIKDLDTPLSQELAKISSITDTALDNKFLAVLYNISDLLHILPFRRLEQQDAHECILHILDKLTPDPDSPFYKIFHGKTETCIHCLKCGTTKKVLEDFNSINLNIPVEKSNIVELFQGYLELETMTEDLYCCETCQGLQAYQKKTSLNILPQVLIVVLKRYTFTGSKIVSEVQFGDTLNVREQSTGQVFNYTLRSVINHFGNLFNGHYSSFVKQNMWLYVDDECVQPRTPVIDNAYILFYEK